VNVLINRRLWTVVVVAPYYLFILGMEIGKEYVL
jgi:hypothetical protein